MPASPRGPGVVGPWAPWRWRGPAEAVAFESEGVRRALLRLGSPLYAIRRDGRLGVATEGEPETSGRGGEELAAIAPAAPPEALGDPDFRAVHGVRLAYAAGAMANGIASEDLVIALGRRGLLAAFGAAGLLPARIAEAIDRIQAVLPSGPCAFNLIHSPSEEALERRTVELYLRRGVRAVEASAFLALTPHIVEYRVAGLAAGGAGGPVIGNRVIAKVSRREVARHFLAPAPADIVARLVAAGRVTPEQAALAARVPMADDVTVEADSGGHTDNRPLVALLPSMVALRDELQRVHRFARPVRIGAAGGIGTPHAVLAAFAMGAAYVVTGSVNQACLQAGSSEHVKRLLAEAEMPDVAMAPAADMFEMGVRLQVLKRGTMFAARAQRLHELYRRHGGLGEIPHEERLKLERQVFRRSLEEVWEDAVRYFEERDPAQIAAAERDPRRRMALVFRWYLGLSSRWANSGEPGRELDYQVWCGPAMGAFNDWVRGSYLADPANRDVADVAEHLMTGAAYLARVSALDAQGVRLAADLRRYPIREPVPA
jgi:PfaD family protein